ncbi:MAG: phage tail protein [Tardiphaga sp.]|jgi:microcystin-dependent protein|nr:phage tail protein [Tardiphaga sp.]
MSDPFLAEIRIFACSFAPLNWQLCNGQLVPITQNAALFSLIGTYFGGDGVRTFALPDLEGNVPVGVGTGPGLSTYNLGDFDGAQTVTLVDAQNPVHNHAVQATAAIADSTDPKGRIYAKGQYVNGDGTKGVVQLYGTAAPNVAQNGAAIGSTGGGQPHNNMMPTLAVNFCICMSGIFPSRP